MSYLPLAVILGLLVLGAAVTLTILFSAYREGYFDALASDAYIIFDEDEPVGQAQDQFFREQADPTHDGESTTSPPRS